MSEVQDMYQLDCLEVQRSTAEKNNFDDNAWDTLHPERVRQEEGRSWHKPER